VLEGDRVRFTDDYVYTDVLAYYDGSFESVTAHEEEDEDGNKVLHFNYFGVKPEKRDFDYFKGVVADVLGV
ncbi:MAG: hypothetical protein IKA99_02955, partial [Clostridia bacterium]|nr:hypothetical protein [Clostridia bacterium]